MQERALRREGVGGEEAKRLRNRHVLLQVVVEAHVHVVVLVVNVRTKCVRMS